MGDREADSYDLFVQPKRSHSHLLIRAAHNRKVRPELDDLIPTLEPAAVLGQQTIELERDPQRPAQTAPLTVRGLQVTIAVPRHPKPLKACESVILNVLLWKKPRHQLKASRFAGSC